MSAKTHLRLVQADQLIRSGVYPNCQDLMRHLNASERTVLRDIDALKEVYQAPIKYSKRHNGYYYADPTYSLEKVPLTEGELVALLMVRPLMETYRHTPFYLDLESVFLKLHQVLPDFVELKGHDPLAVSIDMYESLHVNQREVKVFSHLSKILGAGKKSKIDYKENTDKISILIGSPHKLTFMNGVWHLLFTSDDTQKSRFLQVRRIHKIRQLKETAELYVETITTPIPTQWVSPLPTTQGITVKARFIPRISEQVAERLNGKATIIERGPRGELLVEWLTEDPNSLYHWLLSFGPQVEVLEPLAFRSRMRKDLVAMVTVY